MFNLIKCLFDNHHLIHMFTMSIKQNLQLYWQEIVKLHVLQILKIKEPFAHGDNVTKCITSVVNMGTLMFYDKQECAKWFAGL